MFQQITSLIRDNKALRLSLLAGAGLLMIIGLLVVLWPRPNYPQYQTQATGLNASRSFATLSGSKLFAYNGLAFFTIDTAQNNKLDILSRPGKLPAPDNVYWADDKGALMTFKASFISTTVEAALQAKGLEVNDETSRYTWYFNFKDSSLNLAYPGPISSGLAVYSQADGGFYFTSDDSAMLDLVTADNNQSVPVTYKLYFYKLATKTLSTVNESLGVTTIEYMAECRIGDQRLCLAARSIDNSKLGLYGVNTTGRVKKFFETGGRIIPTNQPNLFATTDQQPATSNKNSQEDAAEPKNPLILRNIADGSKTALGFDVATENIVLNFSGKSFYALIAGTPVDGRIANGYYSGEIKGQRVTSQLRLLSNSDKSPYQQGFINQSGYGTNQTVLVTAATNDQFLISPKSATPPMTTIPNPKVATQTVENCVKNNASTYQYFNDIRQFKVFFIDDASRSAKMQAFSTCLINTSAGQLAGYSYYFGTEDPWNGRITSD